MSTKLEHAPWCDWVGQHDPTDPPTGDPICIGKVAELPLSRPQPFADDPDRTVRVNLLQHPGEPVVLDFAVNSMWIMQLTLGEAAEVATLILAEIERARQS